MDLFRIVLIIVFVKYPNICRCYFMYESVYFLIRKSIPSLENSVEFYVEVLDIFRIQVAYSRFFWFDYLITLICFYLQINILMSHIYLVTVPLSVQIMEYVQLTFHFCSTHFLIGVIGFILMKSWMERTGNERLLN